MLSQTASAWQTVSTQRRGRSASGFPAPAQSIIPGTTATATTSRFVVASKHPRSEVMSEPDKCPMGKYPWLATFLALAFILVFLASKLGLL